MNSIPIKAVFSCLLFGSIVFAGAPVHTRVMIYSVPMGEIPDDPAALAGMVSSIPPEEVETLHGVHKKIKNFSYRNVTLSISGNDNDDETYRAILEVVKKYVSRHHRNNRKAILQTLDSLKGY